MDKPVYRIQVLVVNSRLTWSEEIHRITKVLVSPRPGHDGQIDRFGDASRTIGNLVRRPNGHQNGGHPRLSKNREAKPDDVDARHDVSQVTFHQMGK